ncbi:phospholipase D1/2 [Marchantia polymorpha subsp. ruderalis]
MADQLVHGILHVTIYEADGLVDADRATGTLPSRFQKVWQGLEDKIHLGQGNSRLYAAVDLGPTRVGRTRIIEREPVHPVWNESFRIYAAHEVSDVVITVRDDKAIGATTIGRAKLPVTELLSRRAIDDWYDLFTDTGEAVKGGEGKVRFCIRFYAAVDDPQWSRGIRDPRYDGVPYTFFPQRRGCRVTLYQDAHMPDGFLEKISLADGRIKQPTHCWEDAYRMIMGARHMIYVAGWSVYTEITLIRDEDRMIEGAQGVTLGQLLKRRADEGVRVNILVWDDRTSNVLYSKGKMATHDNDTFDYFQNTKVNCILCKRRTDRSALSITQSLKGDTMFTHHQKTLIVDAPLPWGHETGQRRIVSMVGGLDLCNGRYDTPNHPLFSSLHDIHNGDFYQGCLKTAMIENGGPRQPWHDIHGRVEGEIAWDVLYNFEQRWRKQAGRSYQEKLVPIVRTDDMVTPCPVLAEGDHDSWNVQLFRSIDSGSVTFPESPDEAARSGLVSGKDLVIDRSIQDAYVNAIRRARDFIYIENQYFLGSAFGWDERSDVKAHHVVPMEIALKIVSKIMAGERFSVYVVIPMWPEGDPESVTLAVQSILFWQHCTMQMMYKRIAAALHAVGSEETPKNYLSFFCLGNRETYKEGEFKQVNMPLPGSNYQKSQDSRRFMIYVHSKMMIVDDEYIIVGSANINERSMHGSRDSEIAFGAYQPFHIAGMPDLPHGEVHGFRMALWYEHMRRIDNVFLRPESLECIQHVNAMGDKFWNQYAQDEPCDIEGHLLTYPVTVGQNGEVTAFHDAPYFPDTNAFVVGTLNGLTRLPSTVTT